MKTKQLLTGLLTAGIVAFAGAADAGVVASANFEGSAVAAPADNVATTAANLDAGSTGGTWSDVTATGQNSAVTVTDGKVLRLGNVAGVNGTGKTSTATFNLDAAATLAGAKISFDYVQLGAGGQPGNVFFDVFNGTNHVLRISGSPDGGGGRRTLSHWDSVGGTRTALSAEDVFSTDTIKVTFSLAAADFTVKTDGATNAAGNFTAANRAYITAGQTTFDRIVFTAVDKKAVATIDNISVDVVPEPGSLALLGLGGLLVARRRR